MENKTKSKAGKPLTVISFAVYFVAAAPAILFG
jgi:hypothetical protein